MGVQRPPKYIVRDQGLGSRLPSAKDQELRSYGVGEADTMGVERFLGLDVGNKRIGVAVTDELGLTAQPVLTLARTGSRREALRSIARLARRFGVAGIVVGDPVHASGEVSEQAEKTRSFAAELGELTRLPILLWDERLTSHEAHEILYRTGRRRQEHQAVVDQVAAVLILTSFLENREREQRARSRE